MFLFDCGEGTQRQMMRYGVGFAFAEIFFTHYHSRSHSRCHRPAPDDGAARSHRAGALYGPRGAQRVLGAAISRGHREARFPVEIGRCAGDRLPRAVTTSWSSRPSTGPTRSGTPWPSTSGWAASIRSGHGSWAFPRARSGAGCIGGETVTLPDGRRWSARGSRRGAAAWPHDGLLRRYPAAPPADRGRARRRPAGARGHLWRGRAGAGAGDGPLDRRRGGPVAAEAGVRQLVLTHISPRYDRDAAELAAEARAIFPETIIARDGLTVDVPYAD